MRDNDDANVYHKNILSKIDDKNLEILKKK
jgi:hypothetical protein